MKSLYKDDGKVNTINVNSIIIVIGQNEYQLTEVMGGYIKLEKTEGSYNLSILPQECNSILIK
jgi:hypothetical protein